ncbi:MAG: hypothetical protein R2874_07780 [Desulfobacterales bacterium]
MTDMDTDRALLQLWAEWMPLFTWGGAGWQDRGQLRPGGSQPLTTGFAALDYALLPKLDLSLAVSGMGRVRISECVVCRVHRQTAVIYYQRGYRYAEHSASGHEVTLQLYRLFFFIFLARWRSV